MIASKLKYAGDEVDAMAAIATAYKNRSIKEFEDMLAKYKKREFRSKMWNCFCSHKHTHT